MAISREEVLHVARACAVRADRRGDRAAHRGARSDPRCGRRRRRARSRRRSADLASARPRQRLGRGRAACLARSRRRLRERSRSRGRPLPRSAGGRVIDTLRLTAEGAMDLLERREVSAAELHAAYLDAIAERDPELHCYLRTCDEPNGDGIPIALKDVISTKGVETTAGSKILSGYTPVFDSTVAARVKGAGLSLLGKTNTDEFAMGSSTENSAWGPSRNPWDPSRVPGGSGGGTAAAVSAGLAPWGLGSDTGGSIKQPSALCGNVGLRPTYGTVSRYGIVAFASSLDQIGPVAKTVRDVALLYSIIAGRDPLDSTTAELPEAVRLPESDSLAGVRLGGAEAGGRPGRDRAGCARSVRERARARTRARRRGRGVRPPALRTATACRATTSSRRPRRRRTSRATTACATGRASRARRTARWSIAPATTGSAPEPKRRIMLGTYALAAGYYDAFYGQAQKVRTLLIREHREALEGFDAIVTPTSPTVAFPIGDRAADPLAMYACDLLTIPSCLAGLPGSLDPVRALGGAPGRAAAHRTSSSARTGSSASAMPSSRRSGSTPSRSGCDDLGTGDRAGDPRPAEDADEDVLPLRCRLRRGGEHPDLPGLPRISGRASGDEPPCDRVDDQARARARVRDRRARGLRAQELLLPRSPQGLSDLSVRSTVLH